MSFHFYYCCPTALIYWWHHPWPAILIHGACMVFNIQMHPIKSIAIFSLELLHLFEEQSTKLITLSLVRAMILGLSQFKRTKTDRFHLTFSTHSLAHAYSCALSTRFYATEQLSGKLLRVPGTVIISSLSSSLSSSSLSMLPHKIVSLSVLNAVGLALGILYFVFLYVTLQGRHSPADRPQLITTTLKIPTTGGYWAIATARLFLTFQRKKMPDQMIESLSVNFLHSTKLLPGFPLILASCLVWWVILESYFGILSGKRNNLTVVIRWCQQKMDSLLCQCEMLCLHLSMPLILYMMWHVMQQANWCEMLKKRKLCLVTSNMELCRKVWQESLRGYAHGSLCLLKWSIWVV